MSYPAQIVFTEDDRGRRWRGRLLRAAACIDTQLHDRPVRWTPRFDIAEGDDGRFYVTMQGGPDPRGRRYATHESLTTAQKHGIRWAGQRFRALDEDTSP